MRGLDTSLLGTSKLLDESFSNAIGDENPNQSEILALKSDIKNIQDYLVQKNQSLKTIQSDISKLKIELSKINSSISNHEFYIPELNLMDINAIFNRQSLLNFIIPDLEGKITIIENDIKSKNDLIAIKQTKIRSLQIPRIASVGTISLMPKNNINSLIKTTPTSAIVIANSSDSNVPKNENGSGEALGIDVNNNALGINYTLKQSSGSIFTTKNIIIGTLILGLVGFGIYKSGVIKGLKF